MSEPLRAPFPYFGGKSRVADLVWSRFGDCQNYVEPFSGSLAVLLSRPHKPKTETVNDADCFVANFWRALQSDPAAVASFADWPVNEADLEARHRWLVSRDVFREQMKHDPEYYDAKIAGWWVWGKCSWIGDGWCDMKSVRRKIPSLSSDGMGVNCKSSGINTLHLLSERLRRVRVACGDWYRVMGDSVTVDHGLTAILLDPPYDKKQRYKSIYAVDADVSPAVREWCLQNGSNKLLRIAICGYEGDGNEQLEQHGWQAVAWKAQGGYGSQGEGRGRENAERERIWFSPHCLHPGKTNRQEAMPL